MERTRLKNLPRWRTTFTKLTIHCNLYENLTEHDEASRPVASRN